MRSRGGFGARMAGTLLAGLGLCGCGEATLPPIGQTYEVRGQVLLANGSPLAQGRVTLVPTEPKAVPASGEIGRDGRFTLTTKSPDDGALPGEYKVRIEPGPSDPKRPNKPPYPLKYIDEDSSNIRVVVKAESNTLEPIRLK